MVEGVRVHVGPHCSGVRPTGCPHKFHHFTEQNVIGSARIACLCFSFVEEPKAIPSITASVIRIN